MGRPIGSVLVDGRAVDPSEASISVFDLGFQRGYGCFEIMRSYDGVIFRREAHLDRLGRSAAMLHIPLPDRDLLEAWCAAVTADECVIRVLVSAGADVHNIGSGSRVVVYAEELTKHPPTLSLQTRVAPWHSDGTLFELTGAKALSYGFNLAATIAAQRDGYDDALLVGESGHVLEGPTYSIGWVRDRTLFTPSLDLGILESITRTAVIDAATRAGFEVVEGLFTLDDVLSSEETIVMSTVREVLPAAKIDRQVLPPGQHHEVLAAAFRQLVEEEAGSGE